MMQSKILPLVLTLGAGLLLGGCASAPPVGRTTIDTVDAPVEDLFQQALCLLGEMHFKIDQADAAQGRIVTRPLAGAQWFEFWRRDNVNAVQFNAANMHSIRRHVRLEITRRDHTTHVGCRVFVQRLSVPPQPVTGSSHAYRIFTDSDPSTQSLRPRPEQQAKMAWVDLGEDHALANRIRNRLIRRCTHRIERTNRNNKPLGNNT